MNSNENAAPTVEIGEANFDREVLNARQPVVVELHRHVRYLSLWFHNKARTGDLVSRLIRYVGLVQGLAVPMRVKALILVGMLALMFWLNWRFAMKALLAPGSRPCQVLMPVLEEIAAAYPRSINQQNEQIMKTHKIQNTQNPIGSSPLRKGALLAGLLFLGLAVSGLAAERDNLDQRIRNLADKFEAMQAKPGKRISPEVLRNAQGIILLDGTRAGLLFAYQHAGGVAMVKDSRTGEWGSASFVGANEASQGLLIGGERSLTVIVITNADATWSLVGPIIKFGGEASGTAGNATSKTEGVISSVEQPATVYRDSRGLYAGAAIKGGAIWPDADANLALYGQPLSAKEILFDGKVKPTAAGKELAQRISEASK